MPALASCRVSAPAFRHRRRSVVFMVNITVAVHKFNTHRTVVRLAVTDTNEMFRTELRIGTADLLRIRNGNAGRRRTFAVPEIRRPPRARRTGVLFSLGLTDGVIRRTRLFQAGILVFTGIRMRPFIKTFLSRSTTDTLTDGDTFVPAAFLSIGAFRIARAFIFFFGENRFPAVRSKGRTHSSEFDGAGH